MFLEKVISQISVSDFFFVLFLKRYLSITHKTDVTMSHKGFSCWWLQIQLYDVDELFVRNDRYYINILSVKWTAIT